MKAVNVLPPGQSGFVSLLGQLQGTLTGNPADFGPHLDDQRALYWGLQYKNGLYQEKGGEPLRPKSGVEVYFDDYGVPAIYAENVYDIWYGAGYVAAQQRLFLMDAVRRLGSGRLAELTGCGSVASDLQARVLTYSDADYQDFFARLTPDSRAAVEGYVAGANAWIGQITLDPTQLPAEYILLSALPEPFTPRDVMAGGVLITRTVAAEGGNEFLNIRMLKLLEERYGKAEGRARFQDLVWLEDRKAAVTVPLEEGEFANQPAPPQGYDAAFQARADWATALPETIWKGIGTGLAPEAFPCNLPLKRAPASAFPGLGRSAAPLSAAVQRAAAVARTDAKIRKLVASVSSFRLGRGSFAFALNRSRTRDGGALLVSAPQLGYSYPTQLYELEIHGAGYHARGVSVPLLPVVGIGYSEHLAWALTTGYSKTIDSFIETICSSAQIAAGDCAANQYFHDGAWNDMDCRTETVSYRAAAQGVPAGPPILSASTQVCRTVHGPIVARDDAAGLARSVAYAMYFHEIDNIEGVREWNRAKNLAGFLDAARRVSWNENVTVATRDGDIAYVHPGRYPRRPASGDQRLPLRGTGEDDFSGWLSFEELPQAVNPRQGYLANWNNKPAYGWLEGEGLSPTSRPGGAGQRVTSLLDQLGARADWSFEDLKTIEQTGGLRDHRLREYRPLLASLRAAGGLSQTEAAALDRMLAWDGRTLGEGEDPAAEDARDGPAATILNEFVTALREDLFGDYRNLVIDPEPPADPISGAAPPPVTVFNRQSGVGSHVYDQSVMDNLITRIFHPGSSSLSPQVDYLAGRAPDEVLRAGLRTALSRLAQQFGAADPPAVGDLDGFRRPHPRSQICSLSGVIGPGADTLPGTECVTMPYLDRGSWIHLVGYERP